MPTYRNPNLKSSLPGYTTRITARRTPTSSVGRTGSYEATRTQDGRPTPGTKPVDEWETKYEPKYTEWGEAREREAKIAADRAIAEARARLGYTASAGPGMAGAWEANRLALERKALETQGKISTLGEDFTMQAWERWQNREDIQSFQLSMMEKQMYLQNEYRMEQMRLQAELNDPSWWETLGSIAGMIPFFGGPLGLGLWGAGTAAATGGAGGIVGGGVGGGWSAAG